MPREKTVEACIPLFVDRVDDGKGERFFAGFDCSHGDWWIEFSSFNFQETFADLATRNVDLLDILVRLTDMLGKIIHARLKATEIGTELGSVEIMKGCATLRPWQVCLALKT